MKDLSPESAIILLLILTTLFLFNLLPTYSQLEEGESIMIGYSKSYMFPLLDGGRLDFERGEELWGMSLDKPANITLTSPSGRSRIYHLQPLKQTLIKSFKENGEGGEMDIKFLKIEMYGKS